MGQHLPTGGSHPPVGDARSDIVVLGAKREVLRAVSVQELMPGHSPQTLWDSVRDQGAIQSPYLFVEIIKSSSPLQ
jgi:hypothetical protein